MVTSREATAASSLAGRSGGRPFGHMRTRAWRSIRVRMLVPIVVATTGVIILSLIQTGDALTMSAQADRARLLARAATDVVVLAHELGQEFAESNHARRQGSSWDTLDDDKDRSNRAMDAANNAFGVIREYAPTLSNLTVRAEQSLTSLTYVRTAAPRAPDGSLEVFTYYDDMMRALLTVAEAIPAQLSDPHLIELARSIAAVGQLDRLAALQLDVVGRALTLGQLRAVDARVLPQWVGEENTEVYLIGALGTAGQLYTEAMSGGDISTAAGIRQSIMETQGGPASLAIDVVIWINSQSARIEGLTQLRNTLAETLASDADALGQDARNRTFVTAGLAGLVTTMTLFAAVLLAVRTGRRLRQTRQAALSAARTELPNAIANVIAARDETMVRSALTTASARIDAMLQGGPDEIGELANALGAVHKQALRLAADQAQLRIEVQAMFIALSRRGQTLVQRQLHLIDQFGRNEADPEALSRLFALDHLAARMRRNEENLLVLAGGEPGRWITRPVAMADLMRAAAQEIEEYPRVQVLYSPEVAVSASVAGDAIHLLAELLENATSFSPPNSTVRIYAGRGADGMTITVEDAGIGMPHVKLDEANERLARPAALTSSLVGTMGLLVVARLAERHRLTVRLESSPAAGTTATVTIPDRLIQPIGVDTLQPARWTRDAAMAGIGMPVAAAAVTTLPRAFEGVPAVTSPAMPLPREPLPYESLPREHTPQPATAAGPASGLPRRPESEPRSFGPDTQDFPTLDPGVPDPESVRARLSSLSHGIAAAAQIEPIQPKHQR